MEIHIMLFSIIETHIKESSLTYTN